MMHRDEVPETHLYYLDKPALPINAPLFYFTQKEIAVLENRGQWFKALAEEQISPLTEAQEHFILVAQGRTRAKTAYEKLWVKYQHYHPLNAHFHPTKKAHENDISFVAIDFETANRGKNSACSIGIARVENGMVQETQHFLIRPEPFHFERGNIRVHGIYPNDVTESPDFAELWPKLLPYLEHQVVVAHNAQFDMGVLKSVLKQYDIPFPKLQYGCTFHMARKAVRRLPRYGLAHLSRHFSIELNHHHAESDASACAQILVNLCKQKDTNSLAHFFKVCNYEPKVLK